jgi:hypothetical protein
VLALDTRTWRGFEAARRRQAVHVHWKACGRVGQLYVDEFDDTLRIARGGRAGDETAAQAIEHAELFRAHRVSVDLVAGEVELVDAPRRVHLRPGQQVVEDRQRFVQLIASSPRNPRSQSDMEIFTMDLMQQLADLSSGQSRLGWRRPRAGVKLLPGGTREVSWRIRRLLTEDPVLLPPDGVPPGTATVPPEWGWRMHLRDDTRPDAERLEGLDPPVVRAGAAEPSALLMDLARRHRWASQKVPPRPLSANIP